MAYEHKSPGWNGKYRLSGWDDEELYFYDGEHEWSVNAEPELFDKLLEICIEYFKSGRAKRQPK